MKIINEISKRSIQLLAITSLLMVSLSAQAAVDVLLILDGIQGESQDDRYRGAIDVLSWSEGMSQSGTTHTGTGGGTGKVSVQDITITKYLDSSSPYLRLKVANGGHIQDATLVVRRAGEKPIEFFRIEMKNLIITSVSAGGSGGEDRLSENVTLNFAEIKWIYTGQKADGSPDASITTGWDIVANKEI